MTRAAKTVWIVAIVAALTMSAAFAAYAMELHRMVLWQVVRACVADYKLTGAPFPCLEVNISGGEARGNVVLRAPLQDETILVPTRRITGVEDPFLQSPEAPNYFDAAWRARTYLKTADGRAPERDDIALIVNSIIVRGQDQLHIHVGCLLPYTRRSIAAAAPRIPMEEWARVGAVMPHTMFWGYRISATDLAKVEPFRLVAQEFDGRARNRGDLTVMVAPVRIDGDDQFLILASYAHAPGAWWPVGSDDLLGRACLAAPADAATPRG